MDGAGAIKLQRGFQRLKNDIVNLALRRAKLAVYREGSGDIARIAAIFATSVNQHQIAIAQFASFSV